MKFRTLVVIAIVGGAAWYGWGWWHHRHAQPADGAAGMGQGVPVTVSPVLAREIQEWAEFSGRLMAANRAEIRPRVSGTVENIYFEDGAMVKKGQLLFTLDTRTYVAQQAQAKAAAQLARAQAKVAKLDAARAARLWKEKAISKREFEEKQALAQSAFEALRAADALARNASLNVEFAHIRAPFAGKIGRAEITRGNLVEAGPSAPVLTTLVALQPIYASFEVDEPTFLNFVHADATEGDKAAANVPVRVGLAGDAEPSLEATIHDFDNEINPASGTLRVRAMLPNKDGKLVPGLFAKVRMGSGKVGQALLVRDSAVGTDQSKKFVYVVDEKNIAQYRPVELGPMHNGLRVVRSGLKEGERVIVNGTAKIFMPNMPVQPTEAPMDAPAEPSNPAAGAH